MRRDGVSIKSKRRIIMKILKENEEKKEEMEILRSEVEEEESI